MKVIDYIYRHKEKGAVVLFAVLIGLPFIQMQTSAVSEPRLFENRNLAKKPSIADYPVRKLVEYKNDYEKYFADNYGFRSYLIKMNSYVHYHYFRVSPKDSLLIGKEDWLYYDMPVDGQSMRDHLGLVPFNDQEMKTIRQNLNLFRDELKKRNLNAYITVAPNKNTIYPEFLPERVSVLKNPDGSRLVKRRDQVSGLVREIFGREMYVDLVNSLISAKKTTGKPLYYKTDTHWTDLGAYYAYSSIIDRIKDSMNIPLRKMISAEVVPVYPGRETGDLYNMSNLDRKIQDKKTVLKFDSADSVIDRGISDYYNTKIRIKENSALRNAKKLVIFGDSFSILLHERLADSFSKVVYVPGFKIYPEILDREKPDVVILEMVERNLYRIQEKDFVIMNNR